MSVLLGLGTETLYREWGYVAMSRGRLTNQLCHGPGSDPDETLHHHAPHNEDVPDLASRLRRTRAEIPVSPEVAELAAQWRHVDADLGAIDTPWLTQQLTLRDQLHAQQATLVATAADLSRRIDAPRTTLQRLRQRDTINRLRDHLEATLQWQAAVADPNGRATDGGHRTSCAPSSPTFATTAWTPPGSSSS
jgi:hypothetical protein